MKTIVFLKSVVFNARLLFLAKIICLNPMSSALNVSAEWVFRVYPCDIHTPYIHQGLLLKIYTNRVPCFRLYLKFTKVDGLTQVIDI